MNARLLLIASWLVAPGLGCNQDQGTGAANPAFQQSNHPDDLALVSRIRKRLVSADELSVVATNVQIVTSNGQVSLSGPVRSPEEKVRVEQIVRDTPGVVAVEDRLTVGDARDLPQAAPEDEGRL